MAVSRVDLSDSEYPAVIEAFVPDGTVVWSMTIEGPTRLYIPPLSRMHNQHIGIRIRFPDGSVMETGPPKQ